MIRETTTIANSGRPAARAAARMMATRARAMLSDAEQVLTTAGDEKAATTAREAGAATTGLITATYDGHAQSFACKR